MPIPQNAIKKFRSFSLLEILVAIAILVAMMLGILGLNRAALRNASIARHRLQAAFFAQEQMEIIRSVRDVYLRNGLQWDFVFQNVCTNNHPFRMRYDETNNIYQVEEENPPNTFELRVQNNPELNFHYYITCQKITTLDIRDINNTLYTAPINNSDRQPARFRIHITWPEYGQTRNYYLNNILTDLSSEAGGIIIVE